MRITIPSLFADYRFVTHGKVEGPIRLVYDILKDGENYSQWWPAFKSSRVVGLKGSHKIHSLVRARLPYTLSFTTELVRENPPTEIEIRATGELVGSGIWRLRETEEATEIEFEWDVRVEKPLIKWLTPILKPLFRWNHDWVMRVGEVCLQKEVERRGSLRISRPTS